MSPYQDLGVEAQRSYTHAAFNDKTEREHTRNFFELLPQVSCERNTSSPEKTTSSVLFVIVDAEYY